MSLNVDPSQWSLSTEFGVPYKLLEGFPQGRLGIDNATVKEELLIEGGRFVDFCNESYPSIVSSGGGIAFRPGRACPGFYGLYTKDIEFEPFPPGKPGDPFGFYDSNSYSSFLLVQIRSDQRPQ